MSRVENRILDLYAQKVSPATIAKRLQMPVQEVWDTIEAAHVAGDERAVVSPKSAIQERTLSRCAQGMAAWEIAHDLGVPTKQVKEIIQAALDAGDPRVPTRKPATEAVVGPEDREKILNLWADDAPWPAMRAQFPALTENQMRIVVSRARGLCDPRAKPRRKRATECQQPEPAPQVHQLLAAEFGVTGVTERNVVNQNLSNSTHGTPYVPVTLPRLKCLEDVT